MKTPLVLINEERQIVKEGWTKEHDDKHTDGSLAMVAALYASPSDDLVRVLRCEECENTTTELDPWPWWNTKNYDRYNDGGVSFRLRAWDKRKEHSRMKRLQIAGALIVAEMERLQRLEE